MLHTHIFDTYSASWECPFMVLKDTYTAREREQDQVVGLDAYWAGYIAKQAFIFISEYIDSKAFRLLRKRIHYQRINLRDVSISKMT